MKLLGCVGLVLVVAATDIAALGLAVAIGATWVWFPLQMVLLFALLFVYCRWRDRRSYVPIASGRAGGRSTRYRPR
jgi:hypothetical protein